MPLPREWPYKGISSPDQELLRRHGEPLKNAKVSGIDERFLEVLKAGSVVVGNRRCGEQNVLTGYLVLARSGDLPYVPYLKLNVPEQSRRGLKRIRYYESN